MLPLRYGALKPTPHAINDAANLLQSKGKLACEYIQNEDVVQMLSFYGRLFQFLLYGRKKVVNSCLPIFTIWSILSDIASHSLRVNKTAPGNRET